MTYLSEDEEVRVVTQTTSSARPRPQRVLAGRRHPAVPGDRPRRCWWPRTWRGMRCGWWTPRGRAAPRPGTASTSSRSGCKWGAGLRASQALILGGKARALMHGRYHVSVADIQALATPILRHRIITNFYAESERVTSDGIVSRLLEAVPPPKSGLDVVTWRDQRPIRRGSLPRSRRHRAAREPRAQGAHHRRRVPLGPAPQPAEGVQRRVRRVPAVLAGRRSARRSTGRSTRDPTATTSRSSRRRPTSKRICCSTSAPRWPTAPAR